MAQELIIDSTPVSPFQMNAYICGDAQTKDGVLIDAGDEPDKLMRMIDRSGLNIHAILQTHAHLDHAGAIKPLKDGLLDRPVYVHEAEMPIYNTVEQTARMYGLSGFPQPPPPDHFIEDGQMLTFGSLSFRVLFLPGHSPGSVAFITGRHIFGGDTLFMGSVGRTDLPLGDTPTLAQSLVKLMNEDDQMLVYPGHGPETSIGRERQTNPFVQAALRGQIWM